MGKSVKAFCVAVIVAILFFSYFGACKADAQEMGLNVQAQALAEKNTATSDRLIVDAYAGNGRVGLWGFGYGEKDYFSLVAGPYATLMKKSGIVLEVGIGAGIENFTKTYDDFSGRYARYATYVALNMPKGVIQYYYENGQTKESWVQAEARWQVNNYFAIGAFHQTDDGTGPRIIVKIPRLPLNVWAGPMYGEGKKFLAGINLALEK